MTWGRRKMHGVGVGRNGGESSSRSHLSNGAVMEKEEEEEDGVIPTKHAP